MAHFLKKKNNFRVAKLKLSTLIGCGKSCDKFEPIKVL